MFKKNKFIELKCHCILVMLKKQMVALTSVAQKHRKYQLAVILCVIDFVPVVQFK